MNLAYDVLVADDEAPTVEVLAHFLGLDSRIRRVLRAHSGREALQVIYGERLDAVFLDIHMPGLSGLELARVINRFANPPVVIFVTADQDQALKAFDLKVTDYLLKPISQERLGQAVDRLGAPPTGALDDADLITVERGGVSKLLSRAEILYLEASGDYVRLHTARSSYLVRIPISALAEQWSEAGFVRIHRSYLVALRHIDEVRFGKTTGSVWVAGTQLPVSRRNTTILRRRLHTNRVKAPPSDFPTVEG